MAAFTMKALGVADVKKMFDDKKKELDRELKKTFTLIGIDLQKQARLAVLKRTGKTERSIKFRATKKQVRVYSNKPHAAAIHWGRERAGKKSKHTQYLYKPVKTNRPRYNAMLKETVRRVAGK